MLLLHKTVYTDGYDSGMARIATCLLMVLSVVDYGDHDDNLSWPLKANNYYNYHSQSA